MSLIATVTILDVIKREIGDLEGKVFSDEELEDFIENHIVGDITLNLQKSKYVDNLFTYSSKIPIYKAYFEVDPAFGGAESSFEYNFNEYTLTYKPISSETRETIQLWGVEVNFPEIMFEVYRSLATDAVKGAYKAQLDGELYDKTEHSKKMRLMAENWRGIVML